MLDIGWTELLIIAVVAIIVVGPKDLPRMLRSLGQYAGKLRRTANEFRTQFDEALRESELDELRSSVESVRDINPVGQIRDAVTESLDPLKESAEEIKTGIESKDGARAESKDEEPWTDDAAVAPSKAVDAVDTGAPEARPGQREDSTETVAPPVKSKA